MNKTKKDGKVKSFFKKHGPTIGIMVGAGLISAGAIATYLRFGKYGELISLCECYGKDSGGTPMGETLKDLLRESKHIEWLEPKTELLVSSLGEGAVKLLAEDGIAETDKIHKILIGTK